MSQTVKILKDLVDQIDALVAKGQQIFDKAGGQTVGQIKRVGETAHLAHVEAQAGALWVAALPSAAQVCRDTGIRDLRVLRLAYASEGIFSHQMVGANEVAMSILTGKQHGIEAYFPIGHLRGMVAALRFVLGEEETV